MELGTWNLELGTWNLELGTWNLELGTWNLELGTWNLELGTWNLELKKKFSRIHTKSRFQFLIPNSKIFQSCKTHSAAASQKAAY